MRITVLGTGVYSLRKPPPGRGILGQSPWKKCSGPLLEHFTLIFHGEIPGLATGRPPLLCSIVPRARLVGGGGSPPPLPPPSGRFPPRSTARGIDRFHA